MADHTSKDLVDTALVDFRNFGGIGGGASLSFFDAQNVLGDSVSQAASGDVNSPTAALGSVGLITQFTFVPVPEPSTTALMVLATLGFVAHWRAAKKRKTHGPTRGTIT